jgi:putative oxidoreductase
MNTFQDPLHVGAGASLVMVVIAEVCAAIFLAAGFLTRMAAAVLVIDMFVAFLMVHKTALSGQGSGELAFLYLAGYVILLIAGGGLFSLDTIVFSKTSLSRIQTPK